MADTQVTDQGHERPRRLARSAKQSVHRMVHVSGGVGDVRALRLMSQYPYQLFASRSYHRGRVQVYNPHLDNSLVVAGILAWHGLDRNKLSPWLLKQ